MRQRIGYLMERKLFAMRKSNYKKICKDDKLVRAKEDLDEKKDDTNSLVRLLVIGTQRGRLLILEEEEGNVLFDTFVMDGSLDKILISQLYSYKNNDQMMTGFVLTCINYNAHIFYSLLLSSSPNAGAI